MPDDPKQELVVALAGPAVSVGIGVALFFWLQATRTLQPLGDLSLTGGSLAARLMVVNLILAVFNLLPAFPMDGGRVLRSLLALKLDHTRATHYAAVIGQGMALVFGFIGFFTNPFLLFVAFFVWLGAVQEASMAQMKSSLGGIPVSRAMITDIRTLAPDDTLARAVELVLANEQHDFPVLEGDRLVGILTRQNLLTGLAESGQEGRVGDVMRRDYQTVDPSEMLETVATKLQTCDCHTLPVVREGRLLGMITMDNLGEFLMIRSALAAPRRGR
jgi:CBS domain-containing protein